jgi:hypothetical protein
LHFLAASLLSTEVWVPHVRPSRCKATLIIKPVAVPSEY